MSDIDFIPREGTDFPALLREIANPPDGLFVQGTIPEGPCVTIVGTRHATPYGLRVTKAFTAAAVEAGLVTVSGLARGIDACVHETTLDAGGITVAVLGCAIDRPYPKEHAALITRIADAGGAVISEYPAGTRAQRNYFLMRNRILAGLSPLTLVTEAPYKSGALSTAAYALDANRDVAAIPGPITADTSSGTNGLLARGALVFTQTSDLFTYFSIERKAERTAVNLSPDEANVLAAFTHGVPASVDELAKASTLPSSAVSAALLLLELKGHVARLDGLRYSRT